MKVELIQPQGYCKGVENAIKLAYKAKNDNPNKKVYILGKLVHNQDVTNELSKKGIITLEDDEVKAINNLNKGDVLIFSAHGHDEKIEELAKEKSLIIYDATCPKVRQNMEMIKREIALGKQVIYIGQKGHKETKACLSVSKNVSLYDTQLLINYQEITDTSPLVINQTTLNFLSIKDIHDDILKHIPGARILDEICNATRSRQEAILSIKEDTDLILIVGAPYSSNTKKLYDIAFNKYPKSKVMLIENLEYLKGVDLSSYKKAAISSGASTPSFVVDEIYKYLISK